MLISLEASGWTTFCVANKKVYILMHLSTLLLPLSHPLHFSVDWETHLLEREAYKLTLSTALNQWEEENVSTACWW